MHVECKRIRYYIWPDWNLQTACVIEILGLQHIVDIRCRKKGA